MVFINPVLILIAVSCSLTAVGCDRVPDSAGVSSTDRVSPRESCVLAAPAGEQHSTPQEVSTSRKEEKDEQGIYQNSSQKESQAGLKRALAQTVRGQGDGHHTLGPVN